MKVNQNAAPLLGAAKAKIKPYIRQQRRALDAGALRWRGWFQPLTAALRALPDFLIIGAQKSGTTSLYSELCRHPNMAPALTKEVHFFDQHYHRGINWYRAHFYAAWQRFWREQSQGRRPITGEASPYYLFYPHAPARVQAMLPQVKLIILLRNPIDRAYSHYHHQVARGREPLAFEDALAAEPARLAGETTKILTDEQYVSFNHVHFSYQARGLYVDQLMAWAKLFPPEQMLILNAEAFFQAPAAVFNQVTTFLGLPAYAIGGWPKRNRGSYAPMAPATQQRLAAYFAPHNQRLYDYLGAAFPWEKAPSGEVR